MNPGRLRVNVNRRGSQQSIPAKRDSYFLPLALLLREAHNRADFRAAIRGHARHCKRRTQGQHRGQQQNCASLQHVQRVLHKKKMLVFRKARGLTPLTPLAFNANAAATPYNSISRAQPAPGHQSRPPQPPAAAEKSAHPARPLRKSHES